MSEFNEAAAFEYRRVVAANSSSGAHANKLDMFALAAQTIRQRIHDGDLEVPLEDAIHAALEKADTKDGQAADNILAKIARGEIGLNLWPDPLLDVVVTLGGGRRKAWRHVTADDLASMADLRNQNTKAARQSERRFLKDVNAVYADLVLAGSIGAMVTAARVAAA